MWGQKRGGENEAQTSPLPKCFFEHKKKAGLLQWAGKFGTKKRKRDAQMWGTPTGEREKKPAAQRWNHKVRGLGTFNKNWKKMQSLTKGESRYHKTRNRSENSRGGTLQPGRSDVRGVNNWKKGSMPKAFLTKGPPKTGRDGEKTGTKTSKKKRWVGGQKYVKTTQPGHRPKKKRGQGLGVNRTTRKEKPRARRKLHENFQKESDGWG